MNFYDFLKSKFLSIPETVTNFRQRLDLHEARIKNLTKKIWKNSKIFILETLRRK